MLVFIMLSYSVNSAIHVLDASFAIDVIITTHGTLFGLEVEVVRMYFHSSSYCMTLYTLHVLSHRGNAMVLLKAALQRRVSGPPAKVEKDDVHDN